MIAAYLMTLAIISAAAGALALSIYRPRTVYLADSERSDLVEASKRLLDAKARNELSAVAVRLRQQRRPVPLCAACRALQNKEAIEGD